MLSNQKGPNLGDGKSTNSCHQMEVVILMWKENFSTSRKNVYLNGLKDYNKGD